MTQEIEDEVRCPYCGMRGSARCSTIGGKNHPSRDAAIARAAMCKSNDTVGSYPGDQTFFCQRERGHAGEHRATHEWMEVAES